MTKFVPQRTNANKHTEHGLRLLEKSVQRDGFIDAQTAAADGEIISGSARLELSAEKFADVEPIVIHSDGKRPIIVVRDDIPNADDPRAKRLSVAANQIAHTDFNPDGDLLKEWGNEDKEIRAMFADSEWTEITGEEKPTVDAAPQIDRAAELLEKWKVRTGDMFAIGEHRLICGDCTDAAVVARVMGGEKAQVMFTDPPYGVDYAGGHFHSGNVNIKRERERLEADKDTAIYWDFLPIAKQFVDGACYMWFAGSNGRQVYDAVEDCGFEIHALIIWHKINATYAAMNAQYKQRHEPLMYFKPKGSTLHWIGASNECTVWEIKRDASNEYHPTQKPVDLAFRAIGNHEAAVVLDMFAGSGSTLVACENLHRRCRAIEISPAYVAVALERMSQAFPQLEIKRLE